MNTMNIEQFFYDITSKRISERISQTALKHADIYKPDHKQISRIINNERNKNNRFLVCDAVISNGYIDDETGKYIKCGLLETKELNFCSIKEILWGTDDEITTYIFDLFLLLWNEVTSPDSPYNIDSKQYLCDYVPYAKNNTYWEILFSPENKYPALFYGIREDVIINEIDDSKEKALQFLYTNCKEDFITFFMSFAEEQTSYHKLDKTINDILLPGFIKILVTHQPNSTSLGLRVRDLIHADLFHCASMVANQSFEPYYAQLISATSTYILELEKIQKSTC